VTLGILIGIHVIATAAIIFAWSKVPKDARVRYRLGLGMDGTTSSITALVAYLGIADVFLLGGIFLEDLRAAAIGGVMFTGFAAWTSMRNAA
jgi:hypothetical protein